MMKTLSKYAWACWLGGGIYPLFGYYYADWQFWVYILPLIALVLWFQENS